METDIATAIRWGVREDKTANENIVLFW